MTNVLTWAAVIDAVALAAVLAAIGIRTYRTRTGASVTELVVRARQAQHWKITRSKTSQQTRTPRAR